MGERLITKTFSEAVLEMVYSRKGLVFGHLDYSFLDEDMLKGPKTAILPQLTLNSISNLQHLIVEGSRSNR